MYVKCIYAKIYEVCFRKFSSPPGATVLLSSVDGTQDFNHIPLIPTLLT